MATRNSKDFACGAHVKTLQPGRLMPVNSQRCSRPGAVTSEVGNLAHLRDGSQGE